MSNNVEKRREELASMAYNESALKLILSSSDGKEYIALGHNYLLINKNGRFKNLGETLEEVVKNLRIMGKADIFTGFSDLE